MVYRIFFYLCIINHFFALSVHATPIITFFLRPCITCPEQLDEEKFKNTLCIPGKLTKKILEAKLKTPGYIQGIFASYWGYIEAANRNGQIIFPRKQKQSLIKVLITQRIKPIMMIGRTIHHWEIDPTIPADMYQFQQTVNTQTQEYTWQVCKVDLPTNRIIELDTITIFAKPSHIYIPLGNFPTTKSPHLYLPDIYVKKEINTVIRSLWVLKIKNFFGLMNYETKKFSPLYFSEQIFP